ncbi:MAG: glycosyltransferase family 39 protein [Candidatus Hydrogenedentes bacterium]|nr:glycosyltransferase family 39 protein [Candidatus Hydrogenedentota bacterium]
MSVEHPREKMTAWHWASLGAILLLALAVRVFRIQTESIWFDEAVTYMWLDSPSLIAFFRAEGVYDPVMVPVYYAMAYGWFHLGFTSIVGVRLLSVLASMLAVAGVYYWGRRMFSHVAGLAAAACMAFAKLQIYMSQEIRNYAVTMLVALIAMYIFQRAVQSDQRKWWIANVAVNILLAYTHFFALLLLLAQGVYLLLTRPKSVLWICAWTAAHAPFLALMPVWISTIVTSELDETGWIPWAPLSRAFDAYYYVFAGSLQDAMDFVRVLPFGIPVHHLLGMGMLVAGAWFIAYSVRQYREKTDSREGYQPSAVLMLLVWLFVPPAALFILGRIIQPCFIERYVLYSAVALYLIVGGAIAAIPRPALQYTALGVLLLIFAGNLVDSARPLRHDFRSTGTVLRAEFREGDRVFACFDTVELPLRYYANIPKEAISGSEDFVDRAAEAASAGQRVWVWFIQVPDRFEPEYVEDVAEEQNLKFTRWLFKGRWHTYLYLVEPAGAVKAAA